ncbi:hypothetical protein WICMUC_000781 [Wickerhamomyces mucosus]|uniref:RNA polymerase I-specific transcription initiation factor RRN3 n=1 Tax=Wickerhamomyces mucosus TaxID=1378264 RepID=A0A9P8TI50_9ASCO|nr:hypothetical protein WICMUC_000781 [Wickerhamomyces mucosus]
MMSIDHQKDHFKRTRDEEQSHDNSQSDIQLPNSKRRKINGSKDGNKEELDVKIDIKDNNKDDAVIIDNNNTDEFDTKMFRSYIKSALDALDNVKRTIQIDVELQNELDELDDEDEINLDDESDDNDDDEDYEINDNENNENNDSIKRKVHFADEDAIISDDDDDDEINEDEDDLIEEEEINEHDLQSITITDLSEKLDSILYLIFQNLSEKSSNSKNNDDENIVIQYNTLTSLFKSHILPTYFTKSTQFILFYYTQQSPELIDSFLVTLIDLCFSPQETIDKRIKALQYLSSYLSRAKNLQKPQIVFVISYLISWLNKYVKEREYEINGNVNMDRFKLFYSTFQVLLYVFCFRHSILKKDEDNSWELNIDKFFQRMIITKFNPLKFCNENVVLMFGKISQEENVAYCFSIIQKNKNEKMKGISGTISSNDLTQSSSSSSSSSKLNLVKQQFIDLEGYFPFDPLFLKTSKKFLQNYYIEWNDIKDEYQSDSDSDDFDDLASDAIKEVVRRNSMNQSN